MKKNTFKAKSWSLILLVALSANLYAEEPKFASELFKTGTLVYSDDFDGEFNRERWGAPKKDKEIKDGKLIVTPLFKSKEVAMKAVPLSAGINCISIIHSAFKLKTIRTPL